VCLGSWGKDRHLGMEMFYLCVHIKIRKWESTALPHPQQGTYVIGNSNYTLRDKYYYQWSWTQWLTPVIPATQEVEVRRIAVRNQLGKIVHETLSWKYSTSNRAGRVAQVVEHMPSKSKALSSNPNTYFYHLNWKSTANTIRRGKLIYQKYDNNL
jgi:hypothetical protein